MKNALARIILCTLCFSLILDASAIANYAVGVKSGDFVKWDVSGSVGTTSFSGWIKINVQSVSGTYITGTYEANVADILFTNEPEPFELDVSLGGGEASGLVIPANLTEGQQISGQIGTVHIVDWKGRKAVYVNSTIPLLGSQGQLYWDQQTGVLMEATGQYSVQGDGGTITSSYAIRAVETNISGLPVGAGFDLLLLVIIVIVVCAGLGFIFIFVLRRRRTAMVPPAPQTEFPPPPPPPPPP